MSRYFDSSTPSHSIDCRHSSAVSFVSSDAQASKQRDSDRKQRLIRKKKERRKFSSSLSSSLNDGDRRRKRRRENPASSSSVFLLPSIALKKRAICGKCHDEKEGGENKSTGGENRGREEERKLSRMELPCGRRTSPYVVFEARDMNDRISTREDLERRRSQRKAKRKVSEGERKFLSSFLSLFLSFHSFLRFLLLLLCSSSSISSLLNSPPSCQSKRISPSLRHCP